MAIVTATRYGQTSKIARFLSTRLEAAGITVEAYPIHPGITVSLDPERFDGVIIGCPVYVGKFLPEFTAWAKRVRQETTSMRLAFFSVSLNAADGRPEARQDDDRLLQEFIAETQIRPQFVASIAGTLHYRKYGFFKRLILKKISATAGGPVDTNRDHELTDWIQVAQFVDAFASQDQTSSFATANRFAPKGSPVAATASNSHPGVAV